MNLDLRIPIGLLFGLLGVLLTGYGLVSDPADYTRSLGINVNLWSGVAMLLFGLAMLASARFSRTRGREGAADRAAHHFDTIVVSRKTGQGASEK